MEEIKTTKRVSHAPRMENKQNVSFFCEGELYEKLRKRAYQDHNSLSETIRRALVEYLN